MRKFILKEWDEKGIPPTIGQNTNDIKKNFRKLRDYPLHQGRKQFLTKDEDTGEYDVIKNYNKFLNPEALGKAYNFALKAHENQKRQSGDPYAIHPIAVANILTELKLDSATIATGLLHDTIEDTYATYETIKNEFGKEVADLVDGVTKISEFENQAKTNSKAENFRKLILATSKDIRVLLVKLADRLHNMRTLDAMPRKKKKRIAKETLDIYAPIANRLGINRIKTELEDLGIQQLYPFRYSVINNALKKIHNI